MATDAQGWDSNLGSLRSSGSCDQFRNTGFKQYKLYMRSAQNSSWFQTATAVKRIVGVIVNEVYCRSLFLIRVSKRGSNQIYTGLVKEIAMTKFQAKKLRPVKET